MSEVGNLAGFLAARYDEAEAKARAGDVGSGQWAAIEHADDGWLIVDEHHDLVANVRPERSWDGGAAAHIADTDPAHRLADIRLKRAILAEHGPDERDPELCRTCHVAERGWAVPVPAERPCATARQIGTEFGDHPEYKEEWKP